MTARRRLVRVPASSANLGSGYDVLAAALTLGLELEVSEAGTFSVDADGAVPADRSNLCVRAFEALHPADGLRFEIRSEIPLARGLGSSAAAIVAGLIAADHMFELGLGHEDIYARAVELEGHPDNVAAALYGGFVLCPPAEGGDGRRRRSGSIPRRASSRCWSCPTETVPTPAARAAMPDAVGLADAVANVAAASQLVLGIERSDLDPDRPRARRSPAPAGAPRPLRTLDGPGRPGSRAGRDRGDDLRRRARRDALVLLAGHGDGRRGGCRGDQRVGGGQAGAVQPGRRRRPRALGQISPKAARIVTESE